MITALVTTYNPNISSLENIMSYAYSVDRIIICDNSAESNEELFLSIPKCIYKHNYYNMGISVAFNKELKDASYAWKEDEYIIFFDQDSKVEKKHVENLVEIYNKLEKKYKIGCLGPVYYNIVSQNTECILGKKITDSVFETPAIITSSMLCQFGILKKIDFFNEKIFLDFADWDLCWRLKANDFRVFTTNSVRLIHSVGESGAKFGPINVRKWSAIRTYYQVRDGKFLLRQKYIPLRYRIHLEYMTRILPRLSIQLFDDIENRKKYYQQALKDNYDGKYGPF